MVALSKLGRIPCLTAPPARRGYVSLETHQSLNGGKKWRRGVEARFARCSRSRPRPLLNGLAFDGGQEEEKKKSFSFFWGDFSVLLFSLMLAKRMEQWKKEGEGEEVTEITTKKLREEKWSKKREGEREAPRRRPPALALFPIFGWPSREKSLVTATFTSCEKKDFLTLGSKKNTILPSSQRAIKCSKRKKKKEEKLGEFASWLAAPNWAAALLRCGYEGREERGEEEVH